MNITVSLYIYVSSWWRICTISLGVDTQSAHEKASDPHEFPQNTGSGILGESEASSEQGLSQSQTTLSSLELGTSIEASNIPS